MMAVKPYIDTQYFLGPFFLSKDRFLFCSSFHIMLETSIDSCDATCALRTDQQVE